MRWFTSRVFAHLAAATVAVLLAGAAARGGDARGKGALWGAENLLADREAAAGDVVTIVIAPASGAEQAERAQQAGQAGGGRPALPAQTAAARVVKRLPNGNLVLEARVGLGGGYILIGGEAARADLERGSGFAVDISRIANLAVVTRGLDAALAEALVRSIARSRGGGEYRLASSAGKRRRARRKR